PSQRRPDDGEGEGDVLARDGEKVAEPRGPEVVDGAGRLVAVVAEDESGEQGPLGGWQRGGAPFEQPPEPVGPAIGQRSGLPAADATDGQAAGDVPDRGPAPVAGRHRRDP